MTKNRVLIRYQNQISDRPTKKRLLIRLSESDQWAAQAANGGFVVGGDVTANGGYLLGAMYHETSMDYDFHWIRIDAQGNEKWRSIPNEGEDLYPLNSLGPSLPLPAAAMSSW